MPPSYKRKTLYLIDGNTVEGEIIPVEAGEPQVSEYLLADGTLVKLRHEVTEVVRLIDHYNEDGAPHYVVHALNETDVDAPAELHRPAEEMVEEQVVPEGVVEEQIAD